MTPHHTATASAAPAINIEELEVRTTSNNLQSIFTDLERAQEWPEISGRLVIEDQMSYDLVVELLQANKALQRKAEEHHRPMIVAGLASHRAALEGLAKVITPLTSAEAQFKAKIAKWDDEQKRAAAEAARKARQEAERIAAEQLEAQLLELEAAAAPVEEIREVIREAEREVIFVPAPVRTYQKAAGISTREVWSAEVTDSAKFIAFIAANPMYFGLISVNQTALNAMARTMKAKMEIPGVQVKKETGVSSR